MTVKLSLPAGRLTVDPAARKVVFDQVQRIVSEQIPAIYTVSRPGFLAVRNGFRGLEPSVLRPWILWQGERVSVAPERRRKAGG